MKKIFVILAFLLPCICSYPQQFLNKGVIEYEVKTSIKKTMGNNIFDDLIKEKLPQFKTNYYRLSFSENSTVMSFDRWDERDKIPEFLKRDDDENMWAIDFVTKTIKMQKSVFGNRLDVEDTIPAIKWKLVNENKMIAGFNCRKAVGKIFDSVYVFAFYTDEILVPGGPCSISGLPGMIMGITIPRMYTSWIATKVILDDKKVDIKFRAAKKTYKISELKTAIITTTKDWINSDNEDDRRWREQILWRSML